MLIRQRCRWFVRVDSLQNKQFIDYMRQVVVDFTTDSGVLKIGDDIELSGAFLRGCMVTLL